MRKILTILVLLVVAILVYTIYFNKNKVLITPVPEDKSYLSDSSKEKNRVYPCLNEEGVEVLCKG